MKSGRKVPGDELHPLNETVEKGEISSPAPEAAEASAPADRPAAAAEAAPEGKTAPEDRPAAEKAESAGGTESAEEAEPTEEAETAEKAESAEQAESTKVRKRRKRIKLHEFTEENDIRYRGPLHYQHFQAIGWICIVLRVVLLLTNIGNHVGTTKGQMENVINILSWIVPMTLPFLLIANFAQILNNKVGYKRLMLKNGAATLGICLVFYFFYYRYFLAILRLIALNPATLEATMDKYLAGTSKGGFYEFNIFLDLFLCVLVMYFLNARPKKVFVGGWRYLFRSFALIPIIYEIGCTVLKYRASIKGEMLPAWMFPLLPAKPPMTFLLFLALAFYIKIREHRFCRNGRTYQEYMEFLKTRKNSWNVSVFLAVSIVLVCILDFIIFEFFYVMRIIGPDNILVDAGSRVANNMLGLGNQSYFEALFHVGFGESISLISLAPLVLLFSYNRIPKYPELGFCIPVVAALLIVLVLMQGSYQLLKVMDLPKFDLENLVERVVTMTKEIF